MCETEINFNSDASRSIARGELLCYDTDKENYMRKSFWLICPINSPSFTLSGTTRIFTELYPNLVSWMRVIPTGRGGGGYRGRGSSKGGIGYSVDMREMKVMSRRTILDDARAGMAIHNALDVYVRKVKRTLSIKDPSMFSLLLSRNVLYIQYFEYKHPP